MSIYDFPDVYDAVVKAPDQQIDIEVESLLKLLSRQNINSGRILELACGACAHGIRLAKKGFSVTGIDISQKMLEGARQRAQSAGVEVELIQGNIVNFSINNKPFDCAIFMAETFPLITKYSEIENHFRAVRRHLRKGGIYIVDVDEHKHGVGTKYEVWGKKKVTLKSGWVEVWHESFPGDWIRGTNHIKLHCEIYIGDSVYETEDEWRLRVDSPWNLEVLVKTLKDWSLIGFFSWRTLSEDISQEKHYFMVLE